MRALVGGASLVAMVLALAGSASAAPPCPPDAGDIVKLMVPTEVAVGREGLITVDGTEAWLGEGISAARLDMRDQATGEVFFGRDFTAAEVATMSDVLVTDPDKQTFTFYVELERGDGPAVIRLTYDRGGGIGFVGPCTTVVERVVKPITGTPPTIGMDFATGRRYEEAVVRVVSKAGCNETPVTPITVTVRGGGRTAVLRHSDACTWEDERWQQRGRTPGLAYRGVWASATDLRLYLHTVGRSSYDRWFKVTVKRSGRTVLTRWANAWVDVDPAQRIYEGSDRFWNYCIRENRDVLSSGGRLYCVQPRKTYRQVFIKRSRR